MCPYSENTIIGPKLNRRKNDNTFTYRKRRSQKRKRVYRAKYSLAKPNTRLWSEDVIGKSVYATTEPKRVYRPKMALGKVKTRLPSENVGRKG